MKGEEKGAALDVPKHWHGLEPTHGEGPRANLTKLHEESESHESQAVREWEARIAQSREDAKRVKQVEGGLKTD